MTDDELLPRGTIKNRPEDFVVDEVPAYEPSGEGPHVYIHFKKTNRTTDDAVREIVNALGVDRRVVGVAGLKDKVAITTQWISVLAEGKGSDIEERIGKLQIQGIEILEHRRHINKLKTGHLKGNRFTIVVRDIAKADLERVTTGFDRILREGLPNAFGAQRFGRHNDTHEEARAWLTGKARPPRDPKMRRFHFSALQSSIFNAVLNARIEAGTWNKPVLGDLLKKEETGGIFVCTDVQLDRERADQGELCPTGPMVGDRMKQPEGEALEIEQRVVLPLIEGIDLQRARALGEGTRRGLRLRVTELSHVATASSLDEVSPSDQGQVGAMRVQFVLPKGAYATTVLSNVLTVADISTAAQTSPEAPVADVNEDMRTEDE